MKGWDVSRSVRNQMQGGRSEMGKTVQKITIKMQRAKWSFVVEGRESWQPQGTLVRVDLCKSL